MTEANQRFPSALESVFLIVALFGAEYLLGAALRDVAASLRLEQREIESLAVLLGNGAVFLALMHYKHLTYGSLFHPSGNSVRTKRPAAS